MRVRCIYPNAVPDNPLVLADTGDMAACGEVIDVDDTLGFRLVDQPEVWVPGDEPAWQTVADVLAWAAAVAAHADAPPLTVAPDVPADPPIEVAPADPPIEVAPAVDVQAAPVLAEAAA